MKMIVIDPTPRRLDDYLALRAETVEHIAERYILPEDPFAPRPAGFLPNTSYWIVDPASDFDVVGVVNVRHKLNRQLSAWGGHIGMVVRKSAWGKGYGKAMVKVAIELARLRHKIAHPLATIDFDNVAAVRAARSVGAWRSFTLVRPGASGAPDAVFKIVF